MKTKIQQFQEYNYNGGTMTMPEWERDGRYDKSLEPDQLRVEFDEYMMNNMKPFTPDNVFEWFKSKINDIQEVGSLKTVEQLLDKLDEATDLLKQTKGTNFNSNLGAKIEMFLLRVGGN